MMNFTTCPQMMNPFHLGNYELKTKFLLYDKMLQELIAAVKLDLLWVFMIPEDESFNPHLFGWELRRCCPL